MEVMVHDESRSRAGRPERIDELTPVVRAAAGGDREAWERLVDYFSGLVTSVTRAHRLGHADGADVAQTVWLRLFEHLGDLEQPEAIGAWLTSVARNECLRVLRRAEREVPDDGVEPPHHVPGEHDEVLLHVERLMALRDAMHDLPERDHAMVGLLLREPRPTYAEISAALGLPLGSVGPLRQRCLDRLRRSADLRAMRA
jgi:RNA polymerase sigma factor (sigma-70 family)